MLTDKSHKELIKLLDDYIDFIQVVCLDSEIENKVMEKTDEVIIKFLKLKRQYAVDL